MTDGKSFSDVSDKSKFQLSLNTNFGLRLWATEHFLTNDTHMTLYINAAFLYHTFQRPTQTWTLGETKGIQTTTTPLVQYLIATTPHLSKAFQKHPAISSERSHCIYSSTATVQPTDSLDLFLSYPSTATPSIQAPTSKTRTTPQRQPTSSIQNQTCVHLWLKAQLSSFKAIPCHKHNNSLSIHTSLGTHSHSIQSNL